LGEVKGGYYIAMEGLDGCGKTLQTDMLVDFIKNKTDYEVVRTREPGATELGSKIRDIVLNNETKNLPNRAEMYLFLADRAIHIENVVKPALEAGKIVVSDRSLYSGIAYQGYGRDSEDVGLVIREHMVACDRVLPNMTFFISIDYDTMKERKFQKGNRMDNQTLEFYKKVKWGYIELINDWRPKNGVMINGERTPEEVHRDIVNVLVEMEGMKIN